MTQSQSVLIVGGLALFIALWGAHNYLQLAKLRKRITTIKSRSKKSTKSAHRFIVDRITELKRPLRGLVGIQDLRRTQSAPVDTSDQLDIIDYCVKYIIRQLDRLQIYTEIETEAIVLEKADFSLKQLIQDAIITTAEQANRREEDLVEVDINLSLSTHFSGYEKIIRTMLIEILDNCFRYAPRGTIRIRALPYELNTKQLSISITDCGPGLAKEKIILINNPFKGRSKHQARLWPRSQKGLGLLILKRLAMTIGAEVVASSHRSVGTTISLVFAESSMQPVHVNEAPALLQTAAAGHQLLSPLETTDEGARSNVVSFERAKARRTANAKALSGYYIDFNKMFQLLDENMTLCQDILKQTAQEIEIKLQNIATAITKDEVLLLPNILQNLISDLTLLHCQLGVQKTERLIQLIQVNPENRVKITEAFVEYSEAIEDALSEIDRLVADEASNTDSAA